MRSEFKERWSEYPMSASERPKTMFEYYVSGRGDFPYDMLRHDAAWPARGEDAAKIEVGYRNPADRREVRSIRMRSYRKPEIDRWSSFGWSVGHERLDVPPQTMPRRNPLFNDDA